MAGFRLLLILVLFCASQCASQPPDEIFNSYNRSVVPFELHSPDISHALPDELVEISGLTDAGNGMLAAIEDEDGILYLLDPSNGDIHSTYKFGKRGDYEAIERSGDWYYVMKSNGDLIHFKLDNSTVSDVQTINTAFTSNNDIEGLTFFKKQLLVACKADPEVNSNDVRGKAVYLLDRDLQVITKPLIVLDEEMLEEHIHRRLPDVRINDFDPSGIAVDPVSGFIYILSADHILSVFSQGGTLQEVVLLDKRMYRQPEGLCFDVDGNLFISSEGAGKKARLFVLRRK